ncbi:hypothetical protein [Plantactinospora sp. DSM 117369]
MRGPEVPSYYRAYLAGTLRAFPDWSFVARDPGGDDNEVFYLSESLEVFTDPLGTDPPILDDSGETWRNFCRDTLGFTVPGYLDGD